MTKKESILHKAKQYTNQSQWRKENWADYIYAGRHGILEQCTSHFPIKTIKWNKEKILESIKDFKYMTDWRDKYPGGYDYATNNNLIEEIYRTLLSKTGRPKLMNEQRVAAEALKYNTKKEWRKNSKQSYIWAKSRKLLYKFDQHMESGRVKNRLMDCMNAALKYKTRMEWNKKDNSTYQTAMRNGWMEICCTHLRKLHPTLTIQELKDSLKSIFGDEITIKEDTYSNMVTKAIFIDKKYGAYVAMPTRVINDEKMHPSRLRNRSKAEDEIASFLEALGHVVTKNTAIYYDKNNKNKRFEVDCYIPDNKIGIEYNGLYWHSESNERRNIKDHYTKRELCSQLGIKLIQIFEDEWRDKQAICKSIILNKIGVNKNNIMGRKCQIKEVDHPTASRFYDENHLMGSYKCKNVGLYFNNELVALMGYKRFQTGIDVSRFCTKIDHNVQGGFSKLLNHIEKNINDINFIQSFVDLRYGTGDSLVKCGFQLESTTLGWKWTDKKRTFNRRQCRANMDERKLSEKEYATELKWYKIYDAGQAKFIRKLIKPLK